VVASFIHSISRFAARFALLIVHPSQDDHGESWSIPSIPSGPALDTCVNTSSVAQDPGNRTMVVVDSPVKGSVAFVVLRVWVDCIDPQKSAGDCFATFHCSVSEGCATVVILHLGIDAFVEKEVDNLDTARVACPVEGSEACFAMRGDVDSASLNDDPEDDRLVTSPSE